MIRLSGLHFDGFYWLSELFVPVWNFLSCNEILHFLFVIFGKLKIYMKVGCFAFGFRTPFFCSRMENHRWLLKWDVKNIKYIKKWLHEIQLVIIYFFLLFFGWCALAYVQLKWCTCTGLVMFKYLVKSFNIESFGDMVIWDLLWWSPLTISIVDFRFKTILVFFFCCNGNKY